jgi:hypothetical protein
VGIALGLVEVETAAGVQFKHERKACLLEEFDVAKNVI